MTHPTEAVDAVAQALALQSVTVKWWAENGEKYGDPWRDIARALLDRIAPLYATPAPDVAELVAALRAMVHRAELYGGEGGIFLGNHDRENIDRARAAIAAWEGK